MPSSQAHPAVDTPIENHFPGSLFMVMAPSSAGKSTLVNALLAQDSSIRLSISATTHKPRPGEQHSRGCNFTTVEEFKACCGRGKLLEQAEVHDNYYATSRVWIEEQMRAGTDVLLEIDWQDAQQVHQRFSNAVEIFTLPSSLPALEERPRKHGQDEPGVVVRRLLAVSSEVAHAPKTDYVIINEVFDTALAELRTVVQITRLCFGAQKAHHGELLVKPDIH